jgi:cytochrome c-type biogenesis protein CcmH/NrfG
MIKAARPLISQLSDNGDFQAETLFFNGHIASLLGDKTEALSHWQALLRLLPDGSDAALSLASEIETLKNN